MTGSFVFGVIAIVAGVALFLNRRVTVPTRGGMRQVPISRAAPIPIVIGILAILASMIRVVGATDVGIPVTLGKIGSPLNPGIHFTMPWTTVTAFSTRLQESVMSQTSEEGDVQRADGIEVLSSEGGRLVLDVTVRYGIDPAQASALFRLVGSTDGIRDRIVRPDTRALVRDIYSRFSAEESYSIKREIVSATAEKELRDRLKPRGIVLDALKIRDITLEDNLQKQITAKLEAKQQAERALIEQKKEQTQAETRRKVAETDALSKVVTAKGEAEANRVLSQSLTPELLRAKEIDAIRTNPNTVLYPYGQPVNPFVATAGARVPSGTATTTTTLAASAAGA